MKKMIRSDKTIVLVSHNLITVRELCNRLVWIEDGHIEQAGETEIVLDKYASHGA